MRTFCEASTRRLRLGGILHGVRPRREGPSPRPPTRDSLTLESNLAEVQGWCLRERLRFDDYHAVIRARSRVVPLTQYDWLRAIEIRHELRRNRPTFGLIDALLLAKREAAKGTVVSGDPHFRGLPRVVTI